MEWVIVTGIVLVLIAKLARGARGGRQREDDAVLDAHTGASAGLAMAPWLLGNDGGSGPTDGGGGGADGGGGSF